MSWDGFMLLVLGNKAWNYLSPLYNPKSTEFIGEGTATSLWKSKIVDCYFRHVFLWGSIKFSNLFTRPMILILDYFSETPRNRVLGDPITLDGDGDEDEAPMENFNYFNNYQTFQPPRASLIQLNPIFSHATLR